MPSDVPPPQVAPGWYPDPRRQFELRWWDGNLWTEHTHNYEQSPQTGSRSDWLGRTIKAVASRAGHVFTLTLLLAAVPSVLTTLAVWWAVEGVVLTFTRAPVEDIEVTGFDQGRLLPLGAAVLFSFLVSVVLGAALRRQTVAADAGRSDSWAVSLWATVQRLPRLLGTWISWALVLAVAGIVALVVISIVAVAAPILLLAIIPAVVALGCLFMIHVGLVPAAAALAPKGVGAWRQSWEAPKGRRMDFLVRSFLIWAITLGFQFFVGTSFSSLSGANGEGLDPEADVIEMTRLSFLGSNLALVVGSGLLVAIIGGFAAATRATGYGLLYKESGGAIDDALE